MKRCFRTVFLLCLLPFLSSFEKADAATLDLSVVYGIMLGLALLLFVGILFATRQIWIVCLFFSVAAVNTGYFLLSLAETLEQALWANRLSYLGSVFLPLCMLMIVLGVMRIRLSKARVAVLVALSVFVFLLAASYPASTLYYRSVDFAKEGANPVFVKSYGPLHVTYLLYLVGYFAAMIFFIVRAFLKKRSVSIAHAVLVAIAVLVNLFVWLFEQLVHFEFELLSVSYIISELFLIGVYFSAGENLKLRRAASLSESAPVPVAPATHAVEEARLELFFSGLSTLTETEKAVYQAHISRLTTQEILEKLSITENTLKYHNKNLYSKLSVTSKKELLEIYKAAEAQRLSVRA